MRTSDRRYYPPPAFYFKVVFPDFKGQDTSFQEVSGLKVTVAYEDVSEGGSYFHYRLPKKATYTDLILKRGLADKSSLLVRWCTSLLRPDVPLVRPRDLNILLLNEKGQACRVWNIVNALPVEWEVDSFNSTKNSVAIETIKLNYNYFTREDRT